MTNKRSLNIVLLINLVSWIRALERQAVRIDKRWLRVQSVAQLNLSSQIHSCYELS